MNVRLTRHAIDQAVDRGIAIDEILGTVRNPDSVATVDVGRMAMMKRYHDTQRQSDFLLRVIVEQTPEELVVVTAIKTSRVGRYLKGLN